MTQLKKLEQSEKGYVSNLLYGVFSAIVVVLILRLTLVVFGANPEHPLVNAVHGLSYPFVAPFFGIFSFNPDVGMAGFEVATLIAIAVYGLIAGVFGNMSAHHTHHHAH
jgi:YggT family protein